MRWDVPQWLLESPGRFVSSHPLRNGLNSAHFIVYLPLSTSVLYLLSGIWSSLQFLTKLLALDLFFSGSACEELQMETVLSTLDPMDPSVIYVHPKVTISVSFSSPSPTPRIGSPNGEETTEWLSDDFLWTKGQGSGQGQNPMFHHLVGVWTVPGEQEGEWVWGPISLLPFSEPYFYMRAKKGTQSVTSQMIHIFTQWRS